MALLEPRQVSYPHPNGGRVKLTVVPYAPRDRLLPRVSDGRPEFWTEDVVREWLRDAMATLKRLPWPAHGMPGGNRSGMPMPVRQAVESYGWGRLAARVEPTAEDISRMDMCLGWLMWLETPRDRLIVTGTAMGFSLRHIGKVAGCSHEHARQRERTALGRIVAHLQTMEPVR